MALRKRLNKDDTGVFIFEDQQEVSETQEEDTTPADKDEVSLSRQTPVRGKRRREWEGRLKPKKMTEEEMMDMALRLSKEEASVTATRLQEEEEAVKRAIQDSMMSEHSQSLIASTRRKLTYSNGPKTKGVELKKKRERVEDSPLMDLPDLSQPSPSDSVSVSLDSAQSCDSTQVEEDHELPKSPVFPSSLCQVSVKVPRLSQNLMDSCKASGFVLCSPDSSVVTQHSQVYPLSCSPTFPKSPAPHSKFLAPKVTPASQSVIDRADSREPDRSPALCRSAVFGRTAETDVPARALTTETSDTSGLSSSQENSTSFCQEELVKSPVFSEAEWDRPEKSPCCKGLGFGRNKHTVKSSEATLRDRNCSQSQYLSQSTEDNPDDPTVMLKQEEAKEQHTSKLSNFSETEWASDMTLQWSEEDDDDVTPVASPSPVFPQETPVRQTSERSEREAGSAQTNGSVNPPQSQSGAGREVPSSAGDAGPQTTVHYYWGVPFCPRGLDPDAYTKVIVAQMEVYEKSLKQAQRRLVKKVKWGEPVLPQPERSPSPESPQTPQIHLPQRRSLRRKANLDKYLSSQKDEERDELDEETQWNEEEEEQTEQNREQRQKKQDSDCEVCPETELSDNDSSQELTQLTQLPVKSPELETVKEDCPAVDERQQPEHEEEMEVDVESEQEPDQSKSADADAGGQFPESESSQDPDLEPVAAVLRPQSLVQCPICQRSFPSVNIEMHAAFCNGEPASEDSACPRLRRKTLSREETEERQAERTGQMQEKCYICDRAVPLKEYSRHTDQCLNHVPRTATTGGLLSALDQSERRDSEAGPSGSRVRTGDVIDLREDDDDEVSVIRISHSPISEAGDCFINFRRQQRGKKPGLKRR